MCNFSHTEPGVVGNLAAMFSDSERVYNTTTRKYTIDLSISWMRPVYPNGVITSYEANVTQSDDASVQVYSIATLTDTSVTPSVMVPAFTDYTVTVAASTSAGQGEAVSLTIQSPEAGVCKHIDILHVEVS